MEIIYYPKDQENLTPSVNVFANVIPSKPNRKGFKAKLLKKIQYGRVGQKKRCVHGVIHMISKSDLENIFDNLFEIRSRTLLSNKKYFPKSELLGYLIGNEINSNINNLNKNKVIIIGSYENSKL